MYRNVHVNTTVIHMYRLNYVAWAAFELLPLSSGQHLLPACQNTHPLEHWKKECNIHVQYICIYIYTAHKLKWFQLQLLGREESDLNLSSVSLRSEEREVRSTENFSTFTVRIRAWMVIPI